MLVFQCWSSSVCECVMVLSLHRDDMGRPPCRLLADPPALPFIPPTRAEPQAERRRLALRTELLRGMLQELHSSLEAVASKERSLRGRLEGAAAAHLAGASSAALAKTSAAGAALGEARTSLGGLMEGWVVLGASKPPLQLLACRLGGKPLDLQCECMRVHPCASAQALLLLVGATALVGAFGVSSQSRVCGWRPFPDPAFWKYQCNGQVDFSNRSTSA